MMQGSPWRVWRGISAGGLPGEWLRRLASLKLSLVVLAWLACAVALAYAGALSPTWALAAPLTLLALNLAAAVATHPVFRQQTALLVFHLALIAMVLLLAAGRLTYLKGQLELTEGVEFSGQLTHHEAGPWHPSRLERVRFVNEGFSIGYAPGIRREKTRNRVRYADAAGQSQSAEIGDQTPLVLQGYRFYTSHNKGFAPVFLWRPAAGGEPLLGTVHLPSYPIHEYRQSREWEIPGTALKLWTMLQFDEIILDPEKPSEFRLPQQHKVIVRSGELRRELQPGEAMELPEGKLVYQGLRSWMGYTVFYDWTIYWLLAACLVAIGAMGWHFWGKFSARPWNT